MEQRRRATILSLVLIAFLLSGCKGAGKSASPVSSPDRPSEPALETPLPEGAPDSVAFDRSTDAAPESAAPDAESGSYPENAGASNNREYDLPSEQADYIRLLAQYIHAPIAGPDELTENPDYVAFLLDKAWTIGRQDGSLAENEEPGKYGQVLVPIDRLNSLSLQLFGVECDTEYIKSLYTLSENDEVLYYPSDRPFFAEEITGCSLSGDALQAIVETVAAGEGGASEYCESFEYDFSVTPDGNLQLVSIEAVPQNGH